MRGLRLVTLAAIPAFVLGACGGTTTTPSGMSATQAPPTPVVKQGTTVVRWFVGLHSGTQPNQIEAQKKFVADYNAAQSKIYIDLEIVPSASAYDVLKFQIAAGNAPDIVGPVGSRGRNGFSGVFLDLTEEIAKAKFDTSKYPQALIDYLKQGGDGQVGLPYLIYPAFMFYNKDIFAQQNLPDLPKKVGELWNGKEWTWETAAEIGKMVTVDQNGKKSTDAGFDKTKIVQFGFDAQWWEARRLASAFGGGSLVAEDGTTAQIPAPWAYGWRWYYDAMWKYNFAPTGKYRSSALLNQGTTVASGRIAMDAANGWSISSYGTADDAKIKMWDIGVLPSYDGQTSGPLDADTFTIMKTSAHPSEAFEAMIAIMASKELQVVYGGMPAAIADQAGFFEKFDQEYTSKVFPGVTVSWDVMQEMENYPAVPSHEADMPNFVKVIDLCAAFFTKLQSSGDLNFDNELNQLRADIQKAFDEATTSPAP